MRHQNIVNMRGFCKSPYCIVMEFVPYGTLYDFLRKQDVSLTWELRIRIALDIAHAMQYMHKLSPPYLHRDLKSPNILMCSNTVNAPIIAKLADFGTAVQLIVPELRTRLVDQPLWLAPEVKELLFYKGVGKLRDRIFFIVNLSQFFPPQFFFRGKIFYCVVEKFIENLFPQKHFFLI